VGPVTTIELARWLIQRYDTDEWARRLVQVGFRVRDRVRVRVRVRVRARVRVQGSGFRVQGSGFRVQGSGFRVRVSNPNPNP
jgi:hypothetical protein